MFYSVSISYYYYLRTQEMVYEFELIRAKYIINIKHIVCFERTQTNFYTIYFILKQSLIAEWFFFCSTCWYQLYTYMQYAYIKTLRFIRWLIIFITYVVQHMNTATRNLIFQSTINVQWIVNSSELVFCIFAFFVGENEENSIKNISQD